MSKHPATTEHNYLKKVAEYSQVHRYGGVIHVTVRHDDWCNALRKKGNKMCNCKAELVPYDA